MRAERIWIALAGLALLCCAPHSNFVPVATEVRAGMRLSRPLGKCLPHALKLGDSEDLGRGSTLSSRYMGRLDPPEPDLQRQAVRFFQAQSEDGPRFFDAVVVERRCSDGTFYFQIHVTPGAIEPRAIEPRLDAVLARVRSSCRVTPLEEEPAHTQKAGPGTCVE